MILENIVKEERDLIKFSEMKAIQQNKKNCQENEFS